MNKKTLSIFYRACHLEVIPDSIKNSSRPDWFDKKKCFKSFHDSFNRESIEITVIFDGNESHELVQYISKFKVKNIIYLNEVGNKESLIQTYNLMNRADSEYVVIFEDDYLWLPNSYEVLMDGLIKFGNSGTISLYNHPDRVFRNDDITLGKDYILAGNYCYWRTAESNTATFAIKTELFKKYYQEFIDCNVQDRLLFINLLQKYNLRHFTPVSEKYGCSHVNKYFFSLYIDWKKVNENTKLL